MPWKASTALEEKTRFIEQWQSKVYGFAELCRQYEISRQTGYKWLERFREQGWDGLKEQSRAPHDSPQAMSGKVREAVIELRQKYSHWGPRKLHAWLWQHRPEEQWPAVSSIGDLLRREELVVGRRKRNRTVRYSDPLGEAQNANRIWCADFKGWFRCGNGERCDPLTITDAYSRYLLRCQLVEKTSEEHVRRVFEAAFRQWGLPVAIRTDNGAPFATTAPGGLSRLNIWWMRLGIQHERIDPGCPQQNGRHERMHQTLKRATATPPAANRRQQQKMFGRFQKEYNEQRPHEALGYRTPASLYTASPRPYPSRLPELEYPAGSKFRRIDNSGQFWWQYEAVFVTRALRGEVVGLLATDERFYEVYFGNLLLGWYDEAANRFGRDEGPKKPRRNRRQ